MNAQIPRSLLPFPIALLLLITVVGQGCDVGLSQKSVDIVKDDVLKDGRTTEIYVASVAGATGKVGWSEFRPEGYESHVRIVEVNISRTTDQEPHSAKIQWLVNMDTKYVELKYLEIDSEAKNLFTGMVELELLLITGMTF